MRQNSLIGRWLRRSLTVIVLTGMGASAGQANMPVPDYMFFCGNDNLRTPLIVHESTSPRIYDQSIILQKSGTFFVTVEATGFTFQGHAYAQPTPWQKWELVAKSETGQRHWKRRWRIRPYESQTSLRLQMVKDGPECSGCKLKIKVTSKCQMS